MNNTSKKLAFLPFMQKYFPEYQVDDQNERQILQVSAWVNRDPNFTQMGDYFHLDKGLLFIGDIGTGKTDLFAIIHKYLFEYLNSPYKFSAHIAWKFASDFTKEGHKVFEGHEKGNRYYDELCLVNDRTNEVTREMVNHFGNKLLIGEEIIMERYNSFKRSGYMTHFSTNASPAQLKTVYGERAYDRLIEMCNIIIFTGTSRRGHTSPTLRENLNKPLRTYESRPVSEEEHRYNKQEMDREYAKFLHDGELSENASIHYDILKSYNCDLGDDFYFHQTCQKLMAGYAREMRITYAMEPGERHAYREPTNSQVVSEKQIYVISQAKKQCVFGFYMKLRESGAKTIFGMVTFDADTLLNNVLNKKQ